MKQNLTGIRQKQVIMALREHGPLSIKTLSSFLEPATNPKRLREVINNLKKRGAVRKYNSTLADNAGHHYALNLTKKGRSEISKIIYIDSKELEVAVVPNAELKHGEQCAKWAEFFKKNYPESKVVRDWELIKSSNFMSNIVAKDGRAPVYPDMVIQFERSNNLEPVQVGVEIERTRKWADRLSKRMEALVYDTMLDGVLYLCDQFDVAEGVRRAFKRGNFSKSNRMGKYAENFIVFAKCDFKENMPATTGVNINLQAIDILQWIQILRSVPARDRMNSLFQATGQRTCQNLN